MKIVHLLTYYGEYRGGIQIFVKEIAKRQKEEGHEVIIITSNAYGKEKEIEGIKVIKSPILFSAFRIPFTPLLPYHLLRESCDILHVYVPSPWIDINAAFKKILSPKTKVIAHICNYLTLEKDRVTKIFAWIHNNFSIRPILKLSNKIIVPSLEFKESLPYKINPKKTFVVPFGLDAKIFNLNLHVKKKEQVLFVGRLIPEKGFLSLMKTMQRIHKEDPLIKLKAIISNVYDFEEYKKKCVTLDTGFLDIEYNVENKDLAKQYQESKCLIFPSIGTDSFGMVLVEAMACGTPVLVSDLPGPSALVHSFSGEIYSKGNEDGLYHSIKKVLNKKYDPQKISLFARQHFNWESIHKKTLEVYGE